MHRPARNAAVLFTIAVVLVIAQLVVAQPLPEGDTGIAAQYPNDVGIGSDLDGGFGTEQTPQGLDTIADLQKLAGILTARGYGDDDIAAIMNGNWLRLLRTSWAD